MYYLYNRKHKTQILIKISDKIENMHFFNFDFLLNRRNVLIKNLIEN